MKDTICKHCQAVNRHYSAWCILKPPTKGALKVRKAIKQKGKKTLEYEKWRDEVAKPYLDKTFGRVCAACGGERCGNEQLDVDHKLNRGSHYSLKMQLSNVQYLGRFPCHYEKTNLTSLNTKNKI